MPTPNAQQQNQTGGDGLCSSHRSNRIDKWFILKCIWLVLLNRNDRILSSCVCACVCVCMSIVVCLLRTLNIVNTIVYHHHHCYRLCCCHHRWCVSFFSFFFFLSFYYLFYFNLFSIIIVISTKSNTTNVLAWAWTNTLINTSIFFCLFCLCLCVKCARTLYAE